MTANIDSLDAHAHGHIPYVVLLLYYLEEWRNAHGGENPRTYAEKTSFRKMVADAARSDNPEGGEENYDEAVAAVVKTVVMPSLSGSVREVFDYTPDKVSRSTLGLISRSLTDCIWQRRKPSRAFG
jgi:NEDD8-activating enzyme E1 regulatory subunit